MAETVQDARVGRQQVIDDIAFIFLLFIRQLVVGKRRISGQLVLDPGKYSSGLLLLIGLLQQHLIRRCIRCREMSRVNDAVVNQRIVRHRRSESGYSPYRSRSKYQFLLVDNDGFQDAGNSLFQNLISRLLESLSIVRYTSFMAFAPG